jgi:hypothetical protein
MAAMLSLSARKDSTVIEGVLNSVFGPRRMIASSLGLRPLSESPVARLPPDAQALP